MLILPIGAHEDTRHGLRIATFAFVLTEENGEPLLLGLAAKAALTD